MECPADAAAGSEGEHRPLADRAARLRLEQPVLEQPRSAPQLSAAGATTGSAGSIPPRRWRWCCTGLQGTPYIYQGEELGMTNAPYPLADLRTLKA